MFGNSSLGLKLALSIRRDKAWLHKASFGQVLRCGVLRKDFPPASPPPPANPNASSCTVRRYIRDGNLFRENAAEGLGL